MLNSETQEYGMLVVTEQQNIADGSGYVSSTELDTLELSSIGQEGIFPISPIRK